jgi:hypothetical protein
MEFQIDETAGGVADADHSFRVGFDAAPTISNSWWPVSTTRSYYKPTAGTYTFHFEALDGNLSGFKFMWNPIITATYYPTSYGSVASYVSASDIIDYPDAVSETVNGDNVQIVPVSRTAYRVDLRNREASIVVMRDQLLRAEIELLNARLEAQTADAVVED